ncbi:hypothetical protein [Burkholderia cenocepacia]|uniref:hypothetical protein n=1 Tax=Burkholderia cenocepacia TaxID=95486 RepID=UPI001B9C8ADB|nr:hypothetical protein [Burkholderia cenocepacia]MBR8100937.1 hypothetical protein [Burkholderia cenocepacia]MDI9683690.1 hypothetical protein [Burkholderia cenocepacia]HEP6427043.1 hypothetical protein [Burkholderia cenocepacia]
MKHGNGIRFALTGSAWRRAGGLRACGATAPCVGACAHRPSRLAVPFAAAPDAGATAARCAGNHLRAASAATFAHAIAVGRAARRVPLPLATHRPAAVLRRSLSSVRLTLMQDHSS